MSDEGRSMGGNADEDRLPWLEPVEDETAEEGVSAARLIGGLVVALMILGFVVGGVYWLKQRATGGTEVASNGGPATIPAQPGPYKVKPTEEGGMQVKGQGDSSYAASEGADPNAKIDLSKVPEAPIAKEKPATPPPAPAPAKPVEVAKAPVAATPVKTVPVPAPKPAPAPAPKPAPTPAKTETASGPEAPAAGGTIQLGALPSEGAANAAWKSLSGRYAYLGVLTHSVVKAEVNGKTYYRLRAAAGGQASSVCSKLKVAGEACTVVR
jgi:outer membrane biosynthesis protein TonB